MHCAQSNEHTSWEHSPYVHAPTSSYHIGTLADWPAAFSDSFQAGRPAAARGTSARARAPSPPHAHTHPPLPRYILPDPRCYGYFLVLFVNPLGGDDAEDEAYAGPRFRG